MKSKYFVVFLFSLILATLFFYNNLSKPGLILGENDKASESFDDICKCENNFETPINIDWNGKVISIFNGGEDLGFELSDRGGEYDKAYILTGGKYKVGNGDLINIKGRITGITCAYAKTVFNGCVPEVEAIEIK